MKDEIKPVEVFEGQLWEATMLKNALDDNNIPAFLRDELLGVIAPYLVEAGGSNAIKVFVSSENIDAAIKLVKEFNASKPIVDNEDSK
ncbi:DUF2007-related protein [Mucilaginibacter sp.]|uniref:DUF2007-related protein n=1 Tax=Mucilaginibacter sp. TaxID=1882438 RepID=UPI003D0CB71B